VPPNEIGDGGGNIHRNQDGKQDPEDDGGGGVGLGSLGEQVSTARRNISQQPSAVVLTADFSQPVMVVPIRAIDILLMLISWQAIRIHSGG